MGYYIIRRILYAIPVLIGIIILFFMVNTTDDIARMQLGGKHVTQQDLDTWKSEHGYDLPLFYNSKHGNITDTMFWNKTIKSFSFDFGPADNGRDINQAIAERYAPSLAIAIPALICGLTLNIIIAMMMAFFRGGYLDTWGMIMCVILMSISVLFYIVGIQYFMARLLKWVPISGYADGLGSIKFVILPVLVSVIGGIGAGARWYRSFFVEELQKDYVRTARAKGLSETKILFKHVLKNTMIPILTGVVVVLPSLFMGSLLTESFFAVPGLGSYTIDAIRNQDFAIVRSMVFLGSLLYIVGLLLTDISYIMVDPRIKLK